ncbi:hypothetical protein NMG60_11000867 [Bertholletia excelsa]
MNKAWGVSVIALVVWFVVAHEASAQGMYACWGGCYNQCILGSGNNPSERLPCYWSCLGTCISRPSGQSDYQYYCQLGCSLQLCGQNLSGGATTKQCFQNCANRICYAGV